MSTYAACAPLNALVSAASSVASAVKISRNRLVVPRRAVDDEELGLTQTALDEIVEDSAPGLGALSAHTLDREQHLLAVRAHAQDNEQRDRGRLRCGDPAPVMFC